MSQQSQFKFSETVQQAAGQAAQAAQNATGGNYGFLDPREAHPGRHLAREIGEAVTKGEGAGGYLAAYLKQLDKSPLRVKLLTSGGLMGLQEILASWIAQDRSKHGNYFTSRVPKMALYGALVSAPMGHLFVKMMHFLFAHRTSLKSKVLQIAISNLIISPIQNSVYLVAMALIAGARTLHQIRATVRAGFWPVMRTWIPFFNVVSFAIGTYVNASTKKKRLAALRRKRYEEGRGEGREETRTEYTVRRDY